MRHIAQRIATADDELLVIAASIGTKKEFESYWRGLSDVMSQTSPSTKYFIAQWPANTDTGLQIADYCSWAIQRKWERNDERSYHLIRYKISSEYDAFSRGVTYYY